MNKSHDLHKNFFLKSKFFFDEKCFSSVMIYFPSSDSMGDAQKDGECNYGGAHAEKILKNFTSGLSICLRTVLFLLSRGMTNYS
jgi:hypothetical protein